MTCTTRQGFEAVDFHGLYKSGTGASTYTGLINEHHLH